MRLLSLSHKPRQPRTSPRKFSTKRGGPPAAVAGGRGARPLRPRARLRPAGDELPLSAFASSLERFGHDHVAIFCPSPDPSTIPARGRVPRWLKGSAGRRPIEPFELFTSEVGQNSVRIQENSSNFFRKFLKFEKFSTFSKVFSEIPRNFRQNRCKIR